MDGLTIFTVLTAIAMPAMIAVVGASARSLMATLEHMSRAAGSVEAELEWLRRMVVGNKRRRNLDNRDSASGGAPRVQGGTAGPRRGRAERCALGSCRRQLGSVMYIRVGRLYCDVACADWPAETRRDEDGFVGAGRSRRARAPAPGGVHAHPFA
jgi:hypothetical protein